MLPARILVIEDNPANLDLMMYLLNAFGYSTLTATDGAEGIAAARAATPKLIICDVQLPVLDGFEVARHLKSDPVLRTVPLVAVTALAMVGDRERVLAAGFDGYIPKPINPETFVRQIETFLPADSPGLRQPASLVEEEAPPAPPVRHTLLVVDNLAVNLDLARSIFEPHGYKVIPANGMARALTLARECSFDLILSDVGMPHGSGYDLLTAFKADARLCAIPFVLITSTMMQEKDREKGMALGAARFLVRPIEPTALLAAVEACLCVKSRS